jgi:uncharacterized protein YbjT (DUF2867 family)
VTVVVVGAAGDLGRRVCTALGARGVRVRAFVRPGRDASGVEADEVASGDLADPASLTAAFGGARGVFLQSSPARDQVALETSAIAAAEQAGVARIVKISNIPIAGLDDGLHGNHRAVERRLAASPVASTVLQPSFFSTVLDRQRDLIAQGRVVLPFGRGRVAWVDPDDVAQVAAEAFGRDVGGPLVLTGPEALDGDEVAARLGVRRLDPPLARWRDAVAASGMDPWLLESTVRLYEAVARGALARVSPAVARVLGRPPHRVFERLRPL